MDETRLRAEWKELKKREGLRFKGLAMGRRPAEDGRSARLVAYVAWRWVRWEPSLLAGLAISGRILLAVVLLLGLEGISLLPIPLLEVPPGITALWITIFAWLVTALWLLVVARRNRRAILVNAPIADPPLDLNWRPRAPLSRAARFLIAGELAMLFAVILLSIFQRNFSVLWATYFLADAVLFAATVRFSLRRRI